MLYPIELWVHGFLPERIITSFDLAIKSNQILSLLPDLQAIIDAWISLPEPLKAGILAMVKTATAKPHKG